MEVKRRTFEALKYLKGSPERERLNRSSLTSEYMPSYKYVVMSANLYTTFRTKKEALLFVEGDK
jgi:hypothetical protein